jgi:integrase/recombinase XerD
MSNLTTFLTPGDCQKIEASAVKLRDKIIVALLWRSGLRVNEAVNIQRRDIIFYEDDPLKSFIIVQKGKGGRKRRAFFDETLFGYLKEYVQGFAEESFIFPSCSKAGHITRQWVGKIVKKLGKKTGIEVDIGGRPIHPHTFRHSLAIALVEGGVELSKIQVVLGHASMASTGFYLQFSPEQMASSYQNIMNKITKKEPINTG